MINVIPMPNNITVKKEDFYLYKNRVLLSIAPEFCGFEAQIEKYLGVKTERSENESHLEIIYDDSLGEETYSLRAEGYCAKLYAGTYSGLFYALMTLRQLLLADCKEGNTLSCPQVIIEKDCPKYPWRGLHLDESRHFFGKDTVKKYLDYMALYKLNRFHWHLTDDQGWRIEIEKYPLLTQIGSVRSGTQLHSWKCEEIDHTEHSGFYTKEDIREIVSYAKERCIEIIPEIDFPAHCAAALAAYNHLACREIPCEVHDFCGGIIPEKRGIKSWNRTLCLGKDEVITFVKDVIDETADLFPFEYFHVGGDEAPRNEWKKCPHCQKRIKEEKLKNETGLQAWFTNLINAHLKEKGKKMIGWNEVLASKATDTDVIAQYWTPGKDKNVIKHLERGGKVILSNHKSFYFDMKYTYCTPKSTYFYKPEAYKIKKELKKGILGLEAEVWTEWIENQDQIFFMLTARGPALSENAWSRSKDYAGLERRLYMHKGILDAMGIYYGQDCFTLKKSKLTKKHIAKKNGFTLKDFDAEYRINKLYLRSLENQAEERQREREQRAVDEANEKGIAETIDELLIRAADYISDAVTEENSDKVTAPPEKRVSRRKAGKQKKAEKKKAKKEAKKQKALDKKAFKEKEKQIIAEASQSSEEEKQEVTAE